jgi:hypothetical protein
MAWRPHAGARVLRWTRPADNVLPHGPAQMLLTKRWLVEVIEAGLWIREVDRTDHAMTIRGLPIESRHCTVVVGVRDTAALPPWRSVDRLLRGLPGDAQDRLRLVVPLAGNHRAVRAAASACARMLGGGSVCLLSATGRFVPWELDDGGGPRAPGARATDPPAAAARPAEVRAARPAEVRAARPADAARPRRRRGRESTESADLARLMGFVKELRRLSDLDARAGAEQPDATGPGGVQPPARPPAATRVLDRGQRGVALADLEPGGVRDEEACA